MGLDISAYSNLEYIGEPPRYSEYKSKDSEVLIRPDSDYPGHILPLRPGIYRGTKELSFRAGPYPGYNFWRELLCQMALGVTVYEVWHGEYAGKPFGELINFSDCEGVIGPAYAKKLAKDFADFDWQAKQAETWFYEIYQKFQQAFELAAVNGCVEFH